jgi:hypothetical protein
MWDNMAMDDQKLRYLVIEQGSTLRQYFRVSNPLTGEVYDLQDEGYNEGHLQVRTAVASDDGELLLHLSTENGGVNLEYVADDGTGASWSGYIFAMSAATTVLDLWTEAVYDFVLVHDGGEVDTISRGPAILIPKVTVL